MDTGDGKVRLNWTVKFVKVERKNTTVLRKKRTEANAKENRTGLAVSVIGEAPASRASAGSDRNALHKPAPRMGPMSTYAGSNSGAASLNSPTFKAIQR